MQKFGYMLILLISFAYIGASAFTVDGIHGVVSDGKDNPIPGATIALYTPNGEFVDYTLSIDDGSYYIHADEGQYFIVATKDEFSTRSDIFNYPLKNGERVDIFLNHSAGLMNLLERKWFFIGPIIGALAGFFFAFLLEEIKKIRIRKNVKRVIINNYYKPLYKFIDKIRTVNASITGDLVNKIADELGILLSNLKEEISAIKKYHEGILRDFDPYFLLDINEWKRTIDELEEIFERYEASNLIDFLKDHNSQEWGKEQKAHKNIEELLARLNPKKSNFKSFFRTFFP